MKRIALLILFFIVLLTPFVLRALMVESAVREEAPVAGRLVIVTPHNQDIRREFLRAFNQWHRERYGTVVNIEYLTPGGTNDIKRLLETTYRSYTKDGVSPDDVPIEIDIVWGGGDYFFQSQLHAELGVLQPLAVDSQLLAEAFPSETLAGVKLREVTRDEQGNLLPPTWVGVCLSSFGIVYNPDAYASLSMQPPQQWSDLTDPRLADLVALADPTRSGSAAVTYMMVLQRAMADAEQAVFAADPALRGLSAQERAAHPVYSNAVAAGWKRGMGQLLLIAANARYFTDSANIVPRDVSTGDAAAGMAIDFYGRTFQEIVGAERIRFVSPPAATAITPDPVGILRGVKGHRRELANRFVTYLLTEPGQLLWITRPGAPGGPVERGLRRPPVRRDLYDDRSNWSDDVDPFIEAGGFNQRGEWMELFSDTPPIWAAAWMDSRESLKRAHRAILAVDDPAHRHALLTKLADLPIEMADVRAERDARRAAARQGNLPLHTAERRMEWASRFREHYGKIERLAAREVPRSNH